MIELVGDIWSYGNQPGSALVVPTNVGWRKDGTNPMGQGLAVQAATRYPQLPEVYGKFCQQWKEQTPPVRISIAKMNLILFPTKALNKQRPYQSWMSSSDIDFIEKNLEILSRFPNSEKDLTQIIVPLLGCGRGGLEEEVVLPVLEKWLDNSIFKLIRQEA